MAEDGTFNSGSAVTDWKFEMTAETITADQDWHFNGSSHIRMSDGTLAVVGDILAGGSATLVFQNGSVTWSGDLEPSGTPGGTIQISGGTFTGTISAATTFGNTTGGTLEVTGGSITASLMDFAEGTSTTIKRDTQLSASNATFGIRDLSCNWTGQFTVTEFSGNDWQNEFTAGGITLAG